MIAVVEDLVGNIPTAAAKGRSGAPSLLSAGLAASASDSTGTPFNGSWVIATGNVAVDMFANVHAEASGRLLATRLYEATDDAGMKDMHSLFNARDTMHQNECPRSAACLSDLDGRSPIDRPRTHVYREVLPGSVRLPPR